MTDHTFIVFALDHYNPLGVIRSLGEHGIRPIYIAVRHRIELGTKSKYLQKCHQVESVEEGYALLLREYGNCSGPKPFLITSDDRTTGYLDERYEELKDKFVFFNAGAAFGDFMSKLADFPGETLHETIPDFHNTKQRFQNFLIALESNKSGRKDTVKDEIDFVLQRKEDSEKFVNLIAEGKLPIRVTHNDTKINNIMFDNQSNLGLCVLDLDTVMPGLSLYDFGDAIRSGAGTAAEDEKDASKMKLSIELYKAYTDGYLSTAGKSLTTEEAENLAFSAKLLTFECGMRFLTDYLDGDVYFHTDYAEHNLVRARTQFALVADIEKHLDELNSITADLYRRYAQ